MTLEELPEGWIDTSLGEVCLPIEKTDPRRWSDPRDFAYFDIGSIDNAGHRVTDFDTVPSRGAASRARQVVQPGDILFSTVRTYLENIARVPEGLLARDLIASTGFCVLRPAPGIDGRFLFYRCLSPDLLAAMSALQQGTSYPAIRDRDLLSFLVGIPGSTQQARIADELERRLSHVDAAVLSLESAKHKLIKARQAIEFSTFWSGVTPLVELRTLLADPGLMNGRSVKSRPGGFPVLRLTCLKGGLVDLSEYKEGDWNRDEALRYLVKKGDVFVARGNGSIALVGRSGLVVDEPGEVAFPDTMIRIRVDSAKVLPEYLAAVWNTAGVRRQIEGVARTTAGIYKINQGDLASIELPLPPVEKQRKLLADVQRQLSLLEAAEKATLRSVRRAKQLRSSLLAAAFAGKLVPHHPDDEPAELLLERIREVRAASQTTPARPRRTSKAKKEART